MQEYIHQLREKLGPAPRKVDAQLKAQFARPKPPEWATKDDDFKRLYDPKEQQVLLQHGEVAIAQMFMANNALFGPGDEDCPAGVVYSFDSYLERAPDFLNEIGHELYKFHTGSDAPETIPTGAWTRQTMDELLTGYHRSFASIVPPAISDLHMVYHTSVMVHRAHIPEGVMGQGGFPILAARNPDITPLSMIIPCELWPEAIVRAWNP